MSQKLAKYAISAENLAPNLGKFFQNSEGKTQGKVNFFTFQPTLEQALHQFVTSSQNYLILQSENMAEYAPFIAHWLENYWQQNPQPQEKFSYSITPEQISLSASECSPAVHCALFASYKDIFGGIETKKSTPNAPIKINLGLIQKFSGGALLLNVADLLRDFSIWQRLKSINYQKFFHWQASEFANHCPVEIPPYPLKLKVILMGTRDELANLQELDPSLYRFADYGESKEIIDLKEVGTAEQWQQWVQSCGEAQNLSLDFSAVNCLYQDLVRNTESSNYLSIAPWKIGQYLQASANLSGKSQLSAEELKAYFHQRDQQRNLLQSQSQQAILQDQIYIETQGEAIGQINGLSVVEYIGCPLLFGEPVRISCLVQFGDGEVVDVERKNELAGSVHSKGLMIAEACLSKMLQLPSQLPFAATVVFEQSYGEIDGDSASVACFLALVSSLAQLPLPQNIAITGAMDQFGKLNSVGGVNEKIEGFFTICQARGLTGNQGVIIPQSLEPHLSLREEVRQAVEAGDFQIYAVENITQAMEIFFANASVSQPTDIIRQIHHRLQTHGENNKVPWWRQLMGTSKN